MKVDNLPYDVRAEELREVFSAFGKIGGGPPW